MFAGFDMHILLSFLLIRFTHNLPENRHKLCLTQLYYQVTAEAFGTSQHSSKWHNTFVNSTTIFLDSELHATVRS